MLNPWAIIGAIAGAGVLVVGSYTVGHKHASTECEAARATALEETTLAMANVITKTDEQIREARREATQANQQLDNETEAANLQAANFQDRIDGIRTETPIDVDCPTPRYDGLYQLLTDAASGSPANPATGSASDTAQLVPETLPE